jgi:SAM-dependent methyltransferase
MTREALQRFFPADVHHEVGFHRAVEAYLPYSGRILDLGCGANEEMARYREPEREVWGADFQTHSHLRHPEWFRLLGPDGSIPFPDGHFDIVSAVMVLEHVADPARFLSEAARVLKPGGVFVGHTVSAAHYVTWVRRAFGLLPHVAIQSLVRKLYGRACEDTFPALYRMNSERSLRRACSPAGLSLEAVRRYECPCYFRFSRAARHLATMADWALEQLRPGWGRLYLTVTLRKPAHTAREAA